ncbi:MAG: PEP-CTERM sorting domain-containing protein, partial [Planctomycetes bacterium]|nr:PEP-CTERM sorting domain-containing protein [Planctomycetota bacterium]
VLCLGLVASLAQAAFIVENRSGGQNFANYSETGGWANSGGNVNAPGCTPDIGSRYSGATVYYGPDRQAVFTFTPDTTSPYDISLAWTNTAGEADTAVVLYTGVSFGGDLDPWGNAGPSEVIIFTTMDMYYKNAGVWNLAFDDVVLTAGTTYKVGIYAGHVAGIEGVPSNRIASGAAMFDMVPEPAALVLLGLGSLLMIRRRRTA